MQLLDVSAGLLNIKNFDLLEVLLSGLMIFIVVYFNNRNTRKAMAKENEEKFEKKADVKWVKELNGVVHHRIDDVDEDHKLVSAKIDTNHNFMITQFNALTKAVMEAVAKK